MPGKSKHKRGKRYHPQSRKGKSKRRLEAQIAQQPAIAETTEQVPQPSRPVTPVSVPRPLARPTAAQYPYMARELRTIGILAGVILIILFILSFVLR
jgi:hypothetical protein